MRQQQQHWERSRAAAEQQRSRMEAELRAKSEQLERLQVICGPRQSWLLQPQPQHPQKDLRLLEARGDKNTLSPLHPTELSLMTLFPTCRLARPSRRRTASSSSCERLCWRQS